ncbi:MAG: type II toxin-antitoxin system RelE/ParE family toxin [Chitinivibrionales bacterium]|nr:type II toxin-antitoxin system RelE/ParE family toxin [Chitinivibrionales bacterium]
MRKKNWAYKGCSLPYSIQIEKAALKSLKKLPVDEVKNIARSIDGLKKQPRPDGCKKLKGQQNLYRIRSGDYRIIYEVRDNVLLVLVVLIGNRKDIYRKFK